MGRNLMKTLSRIGNFRGLRNLRSRRAAEKREAERRRDAEEREAMIQNSGFVARNAMR